ncbi:hypothetical protein BH23PLA1_BH23PLA1_44620 [soil metagenome]
MENQRKTGAWDPVIGDIRFSSSISPKLDEYSAEIEWGGRRVGVTLYSDADLEIASTISLVKDLVNVYPSIHEKVKTYLGKHILPKWADVWQANEIPSIDANTLAKHLTLEWITAHADGQATFWFEAGEVFLGHGLVLSMDKSGTIVDHDTPG